jgi:ATP-dependent Clp protease adaptor protein ClpS
MESVMMHNDYETQEDVAIEVDIDEKFVLMLYNDDVNTFDHVIECLVDICGHARLQAEQCATIVHTKGKCDIKHGNYKNLEKMCTKLLNLQLSASIEK